jgi:hypothetical protein
MKFTKGKAFLLAGSLVSAGFAFSAAAQQMGSIKPMDVEVQSTLSSCDAGVPAGYVLVKITQDASCGNVGRGMQRFHFESYFDKPVGSTMTICYPYPPSGWYISGTSSIHYCGSTDMYVVYRAS